MKEPYNITIALDGTKDTLLQWSNSQSKLTGDSHGNKFLHLVSSDDCGDSIFLDFDAKWAKKKTGNKIPEN